MNFKVAMVTAALALVFLMAAPLGEERKGAVTAGEATASPLVDWLTGSGYWAADCTEGLGTILKKSGDKLEHLNTEGQAHGFANYRAASTTELLLDYIKGDEIFSSITQRLEKTGDNGLRSTLTIDGNTSTHSMQRCACDRIKANVREFCQRTTGKGNVTANSINSPKTIPASDGQQATERAASSMSGTEQITALRHWTTYKGVALYTPLDQDCRGVATVILAALTDELAQAVAKDIPFAMGAATRATKQLPEYPFSEVRSTTYNDVTFGGVEEGYCKKANILNAVVFSGSDRYIEVSLTRDGHGPMSEWKTDRRLFSHFTTKRPHPAWLTYVELLWLSPLSGADYNAAVGKQLEEVRKLPPGEDYRNKSREKTLSCDLRSLQSNMAVIASRDGAVTADTACSFVADKAGEIKYVPPAPIAIANGFPTEEGVQHAANRALMAVCDGQGAIRDLIPGLNLLGRSRSEDDWCKISAMGVEANMRFGTVSNLSCQGSAGTSFVCKYSTPLNCHMTSPWDKGRDSFTSVQACPWGTQIGNMHHEFTLSGKQLQFIRVVE